MKNKFATLMAATLLLASTPAMAGPEMLNVKLVKLSSRGGVTPGLENVAAIIQRNLPYAGCELVDQKACVLPANATLKFKGNYSLVCTSKAEGLVVTILKNDKLMLSTAVNLKDSTPVMLGGFVGGAGGSKHVFVLQKSP